MARIDFALDCAAPDFAAVEALSVEPSIEAFLFEIRLQASGEIDSILMGVGNKVARYLGRMHRLTNHYHASSERDQVFSSLQSPA